MKKKTKRKALITASLLSAVSGATLLGVAPPAIAEERKPWGCEDYKLANPLLPITEDCAVEKGPYSS